ncbi:hypothetical protein B0H10DRAFT_2037699 [Mycena sp. CBHHK59/15]|nr:hypothetical protein B0H10DRAFT_2037699 [Mycena sp. CBHHK59/15]
MRRITTSRVIANRIVAPEAVVHWLHDFIAVWRLAFDENRGHYVVEGASESLLFFAMLITIVLALSALTGTVRMIRS